jgi:hypothetical protein
MRHPETGEWIQAGFGHEIFLTPRKETYFVFVFYGIEFVLNLGGPSIDGYEEWLRVNNNISPFIERLGVKLLRKNINEKAKHFLEGEFDVKKGIDFDKQNLQ